MAAVRLPDRPGQGPEVRFRPEAGVGQVAGWHGIVSWQLVIPTKLCDCFCAFNTSKQKLGRTSYAMPVPAHLSTFWSEFAKATGSAHDECYYEAFFFGDSEEVANELAELVLKGTKRATAGALWSYEAEGQRLPQPGDLSIVTDWSGNPLCVIETQSVEVVPFLEVTAEFAATEGEGDGSLAFWQRAHREFFTRECATAGREFSESMRVVCERFAVVYRPATSTA